MIIRHKRIEAFGFDGLSIRDYTADLDTACSFATVTVPPGAVHARTRSRRSDKYYYLASGAIEFLHGGETHALQTGDFCHIPQGEWFSYRNVSGENAVLCLFHDPRFDLDAEKFAE